MLEKKHYRGSSCSAKPLHISMLISDSYKALRRSSVSSIRASVSLRENASPVLVSRTGKLVLHLHSYEVAIASTSKKHSKYEKNPFSVWIYIGRGMIPLSEHRLGAVVGRI